MTLVDYTTEEALEATYRFNHAVEDAFRGAVLNLPEAGIATESNGFDVLFTGYEPTRYDDAGNVRTELRINMLDGSYFHNAIHYNASFDLPGMFRSNAEAAVKHFITNSIYALRGVATITIVPVELFVAMDYARNEHIWRLDSNVFLEF